MFRRPLTLVTIVVVMFALGGIAHLGTRGGSSSPSTLDPERYRAEIESVESLLYAESVPAMTDFMAMSSELSRLGETIMERERHPLLRDRGFELMTLSARADVGESGYALPDITGVRREWETLRARTFGDAEWFRRDTPGLAEAQTPHRASVDPRTIQRMQETIDTLAELIEHGRRQCADLGEPNYDSEYPGAAGMAHAAAWGEFAGEWDHALNDAVEHLPAHPGWQVDDEITFAYQDIASAIGQLRTVPVGVGDWPAPFEHQWTERFDGAQRSLESARARLSPSE